MKKSRHNSPPQSSSITNTAHLAHLPRVNHSHSQGSRRAYTHIRGLLPLHVDKLCKTRNWVATTNYVVVVADSDRYRARRNFSTHRTFFFADLSRFNYSLLSSHLFLQPSIAGVRGYTAALSLFRRRIFSFFFFPGRKGYFASKERDRVSVSRRHFQERETRKSRESLRS